MSLAKPCLAEVNKDLVVHAATTTFDPEDIAKINEAEEAHQQALTAKTALVKKYAEEDEEQAAAAKKRAKKRAEEMTKMDEAIAAAKDAKTKTVGEAIRCEFEAWVKERACMSSMSCRSAFRLLKARG
jgi:hypothetical protein